MMSENLDTQNYETVSSLSPFITNKLITFTLHHYFHTNKIKVLIRWTSTCFIISLPLVSPLSPFIIHPTIAMHWIYHFHFSFSPYESTLSLFIVHLTTTTFTFLIRLTNVQRWHNFFASRTSDSSLHHAQSNKQLFNKKAINTMMSSQCFDSSTSLGFMTCGKQIFSSRRCSTTIQTLLK